MRLDASCAGQRYATGWTISRARATMTARSSAVERTDRRRFCDRPLATTAVARRSACTGSSSPPGVAAAGGRGGSTPRRELWPDEVRIARRDAQPRRRVVPPAVREARRRRRRGPRRGARHRRRPAARCRTRSPARAACSSAPSRRSGPESPLGLAVGDRVATLVSLTLTPLVIDDGLARWDGRSEQVPAHGHAILFGRSIAARLPDDLSPDLALMVMDVCGAPALTARVVGEYVARGRRADRGRARRRRQVRLAVPGRRPRRRGRRAPSASCRIEREADAAARERARRRGRRRRRPRPARPVATPWRPRADRPTSPSSASTCPAASSGAILATAAGRHGHLLLDGHVASPPPRSAPRAWPPTCTMLVGNGYVPGHADLRARPAAPHPGGAGPVRGPARRVTPRGLTGRLLSPAAGDAPGIRRN